MESCSLSLFFSSVNFSHIFSKKVLNCSSDFVAVALWLSDSVVIKVLIELQRALCTVIKILTASVVFTCTLHYQALCRGHDVNNLKPSREKFNFDFLV